MIASFYDGRVRIRMEALRNPANMAMVENFIKSREGVLEIVANPRTGSLLVRYDPVKIPRDALLSAAQALEAQLPASGGPARNRYGCWKPFSRKTETGLLAGLYAATLVGGFVNNRVHVTAALLFTAFAGLHLYNRRQLL